MRVYFLGPGAPVSTTRATLGLYVEAPGCNPVLLDTCGGFELIRQLNRLSLNPHNVRDVIITHQHGDHIGGEMPLRIAQPELRLYGSLDSLTAAEDLFKITYPILASNAPNSMSTVPVEANRIYPIAGFEVEFYEVVHRVPTFALRVRFGDYILAYSSDSVVCDGLLACAQEADLFICDALCAVADGPEVVERAHNLMHPTAKEAAELAQAAGAKALALVHLARYASPIEMLSEAQTVFRGPVWIPDDLTHYNFRESIHS